MYREYKCQHCHQGHGELMGTEAYEFILEGFIERIRVGEVAGTVTYSQEDYEDWDTEMFNLFNLPPEPKSES
jgi:hypothetical protein